MRIAIGEEDDIIVDDGKDPAAKALGAKGVGRREGSTILPELILQNRDEHCVALQKAHDSFIAMGDPISETSRHRLPYA